MPELDRLVISDDAFPHYLERLGPYIVMVDESIKKAEYPSQAWKDMTPFEQVDNRFLYAMSAVQIRSDDGNVSDAWKRLRDLRARLVDSSRLLFDRGKPFWHSTNALSYLYGDDDELLERSWQAFQGICAAINDHCDFHVTVRSCANPSEISSDLYAARRQQAFEGALRQLSEPTKLIVADAITTGGTMDLRRRQAVMESDVHMVAHSRQLADRPPVFRRDTMLAYVSQWGDPILWAADVTALAGREYANGDSTLLLKLAKDPRDVFKDIGMTPSQMEEPRPKLGDKVEARLTQIKASAFQQQMRRAPRPSPPPMRPTPPQARHPRRDDTPPRRGPSLH